MNAITTFSILFNVKKDNDKLIIPSNFNLLNYSKPIREITYLYFNEIKNNIYNNTLTFSDIANYISKDNDFQIIPNNIDSEIYYENNVLLDKKFKFDYEFEKYMNDLANCSVSEDLYYTLIPYHSVHYYNKLKKVSYWNVNYYLDQGWISIYDAIKFSHISNIIDFKYVCKYADLFDIKVIYERFKNKLSPNKYKNIANKVEFIFRYLKEFEKQAYTDEYFVPDYAIIIKIFKNKTKRLPNNFDEIFEQLPNKQQIADIYVRWLCFNYQSKYIFVNILKEASSLNPLFERNLYIPFEAKCNLNYDDKYLTIYDLIYNQISFTNNKWNLFKNIMILDDNSLNNDIYSNFKNIIFDFKNMKKSECIAFYNRFYKRDLQFIKTVFNNKTLTFDDIDKLKTATVDQLLYVKSTYPKSFKQIKTVYERMINKLNIYDYYEAINKKLIEINEISSRDFYSDSCSKNRGKNDNKFIDDIDDDFNIDDDNNINVNKNNSNVIDDDNNINVNKNNKITSIVINNIDLNDVINAHQNDIIKYIVINNNKIKITDLAKLEYYDEDNHEEFIKFVCDNNLMIKPFDDKLMDQRLKNNLKWSGLTEYEHLDFYIKYVNRNDFCKNKNQNILTNIVNKFDGKISKDQFKLLMIKCMTFNKDVRCNADLDDNFIEVLSELKYKYFFDVIQDVYFDELKDEYISNNNNYIISYIKSDSTIPFNDVLNKVHGEPHQYDCYACMWCESRKCDPPFDMWPQTPNRDLQKAYRKYISEELPKEYTDVKYYNYMMKNKRLHGEHGTNVYTLFSNNIENKLIFVDASKPLDEEYAELRFSVNIEYSKMKKFLGEQLNINNITTRTRLSDYDFNKVCGGDTNIDCFVFSDIKNIYKEITPLSQLLEFFKTAIETKFNVEVIMDVNDNE